MYKEGSRSSALKTAQLSIRARLLMVPALFTLTIIIFLAISITQIDSVASGVNIIGKNYLPSLTNLAKC